MNNPMNEAYPESQIDNVFLDIFVTKLNISILWQVDISKLLNQISNVA